MRLTLSLKPMCIALAAAGLCMTLAADDEAKLLPDGPGKDVVARLCIDCHGAGNFRKDRLSKDDWSDQVAEMVDRGSKGTEAELAVVVDYLTRNFGPDSKVNVNTAPLIELKSVLGITAQQAKAVIDYRAANGNFKEWRDLQKVPGVEGKKIEDKKDLMAF